MHDKVIADYRNINEDTLMTYAKEMGLNMSRFEEVIGNDAKMQALYADDVMEARKCGVRGTPSVYINGKKLAGRRTMDNYKSTIDGYLKEKGKGK